MKIKYFSLIIITTALLSTNLMYAQKGKVNKADKNFDRYKFIDAREIYLKVVEDGYASAQIYENLGDTFYWNSDYDNAAKWYNRLITEFPEEVAVEYYFKAAQSLKSLGDYSQSNVLMGLYSQNGGDSLIVKNFNENPDYLKSIAFGARDYEIEKVGINSDASDFGPSFYKDKIVFASSMVGSGELKIHKWNNQPYTDLYVANIDNEGDLVDAVSLGGDVNTKYHETSPTFTKDGKTMYFTRNNFIDGKKGRDDEKTLHLKIYKATNIGYNNWANIVELPFNNEDYSVAHPALGPDEKRLYFTSEMPGSLGMSDIWYVDINEDGSYGTPINLGPEINTEARETFPFISDQNKLYFSSDGRNGFGGYDIFMAPIEENGDLGMVTNLGEPANSNVDDFGFIIDEEKRIGYLSSNRGGDRGSIDDDIYIVREQCSISLKGKVFDVDSGELLSGAIVTLSDENNNLIDTAVVGANALYSFASECEQKYTIRATKDQYGPFERLVQTPDKTGVIDVPVPLKKIDPCPENDLGCRLTLLPIYFDFDKSYVRPDAEIELAKILAAMREYPSLVIHIESHTDSRASHVYNIELSKRRAQSTLQWLVDKGINAGRLTAKGFGETQLENRCSDGVNCTEEEHQLNRRSVFLIKN